MSRGNAIEPVTGPQIRFDLLFHAHHDDIYRYCVRRLGRSEAEDAAADVFAVAWRRLDEMPDGEASKAWLYAVAYRVVGNGYRSRARQDRLSTRLAGMRTSPDSEAARATDLDLVLAALAGLSRADQEVLRLSTWDELTRGEIAIVLGIKENAVDQRLHRARARLKGRLNHLQRKSSNPEPEEASA